MATTTNEKAEKIKKNISGYAEKSKETIREMISSSTKQIEKAMDTGADVIKTIGEKLSGEEVDTTVSDSLKQTFLKSVELAEDTYDAIINSYTRQMELTVDFNTKLVEAVKESNPVNAGKFLDLIHENFESSRKLTAENTHEIINFYNKHTNLALNFNEKFAKAATSQLELLMQIQGKGLDRFTNWVSDWWKIPGEK